MKIICWWSGGITSAVACKMAIDLFGADSCQVIMIDTRNEDRDTYRFKADCEAWYGLPISTISAIPSRYESIASVWDKYSSLNTANGAVCSSELKRRPRIEWQKNNEYDYQVFGFELTKKEAARALGMRLNWPDSKPIFPLLMYGLDKNDCIEIVKHAGIRIPQAYMDGFHNNNCLETGCVQGGIGYWQKIKIEKPDNFYKMSEREWRYSRSKGKPVTILKDQSNLAKETGVYNVFLVKNPDFPECKSIDDFPDMPVKSLIDCNGFCGVNDLVEPSDEP